jgi:hypothetical protein
MWEMDVIDPINLKASNKHLFILILIDYFTKWSKTTLYAHVTLKMVWKFIERDIIYWHGLLENLVTNNA